MSRISIERVIFVHDLAGFTRAVRASTDLEIADFLDDYYRACDEAIVGAGGRVVKLMGDAVLAIFPVERSVEAIACASALREQSVAIAAARKLLPIGAGAASLHLARIVEGPFGAERDVRFDVCGEGVNHTFLMSGGRGPGVYLSEPLYQQLPTDQRAAWTKHDGSAVYGRAS